LCRSQDGR